eukprot:990441_1
MSQSGDSVPQGGYSMSRGGGVLSQGLSQGGGGLSQDIGDPRTSGELTPKQSKHRKKTNSIDGSIDPLVEGALENTDSRQLDYAREAILRSLAGLIPHLFDTLKLFSTMVEAVLSDAILEVSRVHPDVVPCCSLPNLDRGETLSVEQLRRSTQVIINAVTVAVLDSPDVPPTGAISRILDARTMRSRRMSQANAEFRARAVTMLQPQRYKSARAPLRVVGSMGSLNLPSAEILKSPRVSSSSDIEDSTLPQLRYRNFSYSYHFKKALVDLGGRDRPSQDRSNRPVSRLADRLADLPAGRLKRSLLTMMDLCGYLVGKSAFPQDWVQMRMLELELCIRILLWSGRCLRRNFSKPETLDVSLWASYIGLSIALLQCRDLEIENLQRVRGEIIISRYGDLRVLLAEHLTKCWNRLKGIHIRLLEVAVSPCIRLAGSPLVEVEKLAVLIY